MLVIFVFSSELGSNQRSSRIIGPIVRFFKPGASDELIRRIQFAVRKTAHLLEYAALAALTRQAWLRSKGLPSGFWTWRGAAGAVAFCAVYAVTDEFHQSLTASRLASGWDVLLDTAGGALGLAAVYLYQTIARRRASAAKAAAGQALRG